MTMTPKMILQWAAALGVALLAAQVFAGEPLALKTRTNRTSYNTGLSIIKELKQQGGEFNLDLVIQGMKDGLTDETLTEETLTEKTLLTTEEEPAETVVASPPKTEQEQMSWQVMTLASVRAHDSEQADVPADLKVDRNVLARLHATTPSWFTMKPKPGQ